MAGLYVKTGGEKKRYKSFEKGVDREGMIW